MEPEDIESNSSICKDDELQDEFYNNNLWWTNGILLVCVAAIGIFLNATSLYIIQSKKVKETIFNTLAIFLSIIDILLLLNIIYTSIAVHLSPPYLSSCASPIYLSFYATIIYPSHRMLMLCSFYMNVLMAYERYNCIANPFEISTRNQLNKNKNRYAQVTWHTLPVIVISIIVNIPTVYDLNIRKIDSNSLKKINEAQTAPNCTSELWKVSRTEFGLNRNYRLWYLNISNLVVFAIIPVFLMGFFNFRVYLLSNKRRLRRRNIANNEGKHEQSQCQQKIMLSLLVVLFIICNIPDFLLNAEDIMYFQPYEKHRQAHCDWADFWVMMVTFVQALVLTIKCSLNFLMYHIYDVEFMKVFRSNVVSLCQCHWKKGRHVDNSNIETFEMQAIN